MSTQERYYTLMGKTALRYGQGLDKDGKKESKLIGTYIIEEW